MRITGWFWTVCWQLLKLRGVCFMGTWRWRALPGQRVKSLPVMGNHVWKSWSSALWRWLGAQRSPEMSLQEIFWLLCQCWHLYTAFCTGDVTSDSSLNPPECRGLGRTACGHRRHPSVLGRTGCDRTPSSAEGHVCDIIRLLNKTSRVFNLAVCSHVSWVQTALFYTNTSINVVIPSTRGCHAFSLCASGPSFS